MRRVAAILTSAAVAAMVVGLSAQNTKFNGKWALDQDKTTAANPAAAAGGGGGGGRGGGRNGGGGGNRGGGGGGAFTIAVDATSLTRTPDAGAGGNAPTAQVFTLDGAKHDAPAMGGRGGNGGTYVAKWDDSKATVTIETTRDFNGQSTVTKQTYSMDGDWLVISTQSGENAARKMYYKKAS